MHATFSSVPWNTLDLWQEANACLAHTLARNRAALAESTRQAHQIRHLLERTFPLLNRLCGETCPNCADICCQRAWVWTDFKDLLFLHLAGVLVPDRQLMRQQGDRCRYCGPDGCRLDRLQRPFVCTWYLCPAQSGILRNAPQEMEELLNVFQQVKQQRRRMEDKFIQATVKCTTGWRQDRIQLKA